MEENDLIFPEELFNLTANEYSDLHAELESNIQHHGVKGMRWGVRGAVKKAGTVGKAHAKSYLETAVNQNVRPIKTAKAYVRTVKKRPSTLVYADHKSRQMINADVRQQRINKNKKQKSALLDGRQIQAYNKTKKLNAEVDTRLKAKQKKN